MDGASSPRIFPLVGNFIGCNLYRLTVRMPAWFTPVSDDAPAVRQADSEADGKDASVALEDNK